MKFILIILSVFLVSCNGQVDSTNYSNGQVDLTNYSNSNNHFELNGCVKSIKTQRFQFDNDADEKIGKINFQGKEYHFDERGFVKTETLFSEHTGDITQRELYTYDTLGNKIETQWMDPDGKTIRRKIMNYDSQGNYLGSITTGYNGKFKSSLTLKLDQNANIISNVQKDKDGIVDSMLAEYDNNGNKIIQNNFDKDSNLKRMILSEHIRNQEKMLWYDSQKQLDKIYTLKYDSMKNKIQEFIYNPDNSFVYGLLYDYNSNGKILFEKGVKLESDTSGNFDRFSRYKYNNNRKVTEKLFYRNGSDTTTFKYKYDSNMNIVSEVQLKNDSVIYSVASEIKYDSYKNWIKKTEKVNGQLKHVWVREIEYYNK